MVEELNIIKNDPWLEPFSAAIEGRHSHAIAKEKELCKRKSLVDFASGHLFYGLHFEDKKWIFREWAPNATAIYLIGDFNNWEERPEYRLKKLRNAIGWEITLPQKALKHGDLYKLKIYWEGGCGERIPAWANRVVQDEETKSSAHKFGSPLSLISSKRKYSSLM